MPHITVTIPTYNRSHLIEKTILSVIEQKFQDWNLIIVDDASDDNTVDVVKKFTGNDSRIKLILNEKNLGLTRNWNKCLKIAEGPLVQILQSDDLMDPEYLQTVSDLFNSNSDIGFVAASCRYIDIDGRIINEGKTRIPKLYKGGDEAVSFFLTLGWPHVSSIVMKKECYEKLGGFNEKIWHGPDGEMFTRFATKYNFYDFGKIFTSFRRHGTNMGALEYLRKDFLDVDMYKKSLTYSYLSNEKLELLGIRDLKKFLYKNGSKVALTGAYMALLYEKFELNRYYLKKAIHLNKLCFFSNKFLITFLISIIPYFGHKFARFKSKLDFNEQEIVKKVEKSLKDINSDSSY